MIVMTRIIAVVITILMHLSIVKAYCMIEGIEGIKYDETDGALTISRPVIPINAFSDCEGEVQHKITTLTLLEGVKGIGMNAFKNCSRLKAVEFPNSLVTLGISSFLATGLTTFTFKAKSNLTSIGRFCFSGTKLGEIVLPAGLKTVDNRAFGSIESLKSVTVEGNTIFDVDTFKGSDKIKYWQVTKSITSDVGLPSSSLHITCNSGGKACDCSGGYGNNGSSLYIACIECSAGSYHKAFTSPPKYWSECKKCPLNYYQARPGQGVCKTCDSGKYSDVTGSTDVADCKNCPAGKYGDAFGLGCTFCPVGSYCDQSGLKAAVLCETGKYSDRTGSERCAHCQPGRYANSTGSVSCRDCQSGTASGEAGAASETQCQRCRPGKYAASSGLSACNPCHAGNYTVGDGAKSCGSCPTGKTSGTGATDCYTQPVTCSPGQEPSDGACKACEPGHVGLGGLLQCTACPPGKYSDAVGLPTNARVNCGECPAGRYGNETAQATEAQACHICPEGTYQGFVGATTCSQCYPGASCGYQGMSTPENCQRGTYSDEKSQKWCSACPAGRYQNDTGSAKCEACIAGKYNNVFGMTSEIDACRACPSGSFSGSNGSAECEPCSIDTFNNASERSHCDDCIAGKTTRIHYPNGTISTGKGATECVVSSAPCTPGSARAADGDGACEACEQGYFSERGLVCKPCPAGQYGDKSAMHTCALCPSGRYGVPGALASKSISSGCSLCAAGKYQASAGKLACVGCDPGSFCGAAGLSVGVPCPIGRYSDERHTTNCTACPAGRYQTSSGSAKCEQCEEGHYGPFLASASAANCFQCPAGKYSNHRGIANCSSCTAGQFQDVPGSTSCKVCTVEYGSTQTNNPTYTACEFNSALQSQSLVEAVFASDAAVYMTFVVACCFTAVAMLMHWKREKLLSTGRLVQLGRFASAIKSFLPGFSFGSELFLVPAIWQVSVPLACTMITARLMHTLASGLLLSSAFGNSKASGAVDGLVNCMFCHSADATMDLYSTIDHEFVREDTAVVGVLSLVSLADATMVQFLPWIGTKFGAESKGWPGIDTMKLCLGVKVVQSAISSVCQLSFLLTNSNLDNPTTSPAAKALFILNIIFSVGGAALGCLLWMIKKGSLRRLEKERVTEVQTSRATAARAAAVKASGGESEMAHSAMSDGGITSINRTSSKLAEKDVEKGRLSLVGFNVDEVYPTKEIVQCNPLHAAQAQSTAEAAEKEINGDTINPDGDKVNPDGDKVNPDGGNDIPSSAAKKTGAMGKVSDKEFAL